MKIINLIEDTKGPVNCACEHGLSFYVKTEKHVLLMDLGPSETVLINAEDLGIDLKTVDTVILSHGHYDHSGGIIPFSRLNTKASIYMQASADGDFYADDGEDAPLRYRYIGIDKDIPLLPGVRIIDGDYKIDEELELFTVRSRSHALPSTNSRLLVKRDGTYVKDDFRHEHFLVIKQDGLSILMSGCAHNGILSILDAYKDRFGKAPDVAVTGFHLMKKTAYSPDEIKEIENIASELLSYPTRFVTCHCTGTAAYKIMKAIMGDRLEYVHSGSEITVS